MYKLGERVLFDASKVEPREHSERCNYIFAEIRNGANIYVRIDDEVSQFNLKEGQPEQEQYIHLSILSDGMIQYDLQFFEQAKNTEPIAYNDYRPYFAQFTVPVSNPAQLRTIEKIGFEWKLARFTTNNYSEGREVQYLEGTLETSASPLVHIEGRLLVFQDEKIEASVLRTINSTYNPHKFSSESNETIERILKECWKNDLISTIDIYNVGHGNADYIRGPHRRILYDIGYNYRCYPGPKHYQTRFWKAVTAIRHLKPNCVILSHWDLDHIIGCAYSQGNVFDVPWIAPHLVASKSEKASTNSIRLAHYLASTKKLHLVDRTQPEQLIATIRAKKNVKIKLWLGKGKSICSLKNREGLFVEISGSLHVLLGGDVPYSCMPGSIFGNQIDYMHVPHHCSSMELGQLRRLKNKGKLAAISTNRFKNGNLNCCGSHHDALERVFDKVMSTIDDPGGNDEKNLSIQLSYQNKYYRVR